VENSGQAERKGMLPPMVVYDGVRFGVRAYRTDDLAYTAMSGILKGNRGSWLYPARMWIFQNEEEVRKGVSGLVDLLEEKDRERVRKIFLARVDLGISRPKPYYFSPHFRVCLWPFSEEDIEGTIASFRYDRSLMEILKKRGGMWWADEKVWVLQGESPDTLAEAMEKAGVKIEDIVVSESLYDKGAGKTWDESGFLSLGESSSGSSGTVKTSPDGQQGNISTAVLAFGRPVERLPVDSGKVSECVRKFELLPHQDIAVRHLLSRTSALLADDMGLGKTRSAVGAAHLSGERILIVCPASLKQNWKREILSVLPEASIFVVNEGRDRVPEDARWVIVNYETLGPVMKSGVQETFGVLVVDEAHYIKDVTALRTQNMLQLAKGIPRRYLLTATPILNRAEELWTLLIIGGHPLGQLPWAEFRSTFTRSGESRKLLGERIEEWMLRRMKDEVVDLPGRYEINPELVLSREERILYNEIISDTKRSSIGKVTPLRELVEKAKIDFIMESLESLSEGSKAIVFLEYLSSVREIFRRCEEEGMGVVSLVGKDDLDSRTTAVDAFQNDPDIRVFLTTIRAGGVGLTLTKANYVILGSRPWTPALKDQAECRADRMGQKNRVCVINPLMKDTIDCEIDEMLKSKGSVIKGVLADKLS